MKQLLKFQQSSQKKIPRIKVTRKDSACVKRFHDDEVYKTISPPHDSNLRMTSRVTSKFLDRDE